MPLIHLFSYCTVSLDRQVCHERQIFARSSALSLITGQHANGIGRCCTTNSHQRFDSLHYSFQFITNKRKAQLALNLHATYTTLRSDEYPIPLRHAWSCSCLSRYTTVQGGSLSPIAQKISTCCLHCACRCRSQMGNDFVAHIFLIFCALPSVSVC